MKKIDSKRGSAVFGLFYSTAPLQTIIDRLRRMGCPDEAIEVTSTLPLLDEPFAAGWREARLHPVTMIAGAVGIVFGILLTAGTALLYPIRTGGKPIVSAPIVGIVTYEMMMLFAIVTTFLAMAVKIRRSQRPKEVRDPRIDDGMVGLSVWLDRGDPKIESVHNLFLDWEAAEVRRL